MKRRKRRETMAWDTKKLLENKLLLIVAGVLLFLAAFSVSFIVNLSSSQTGRFSTSQSPQVNRSFPTSAPKLTPLPTSASTITPTPYPLAQGKQTWHLSNGENVIGPKMSEVVVDPFDPNKGEKQAITIKIKHTSPVISATVTLATDNGKKTYQLMRIDGNDTDGTWQGFWVTEDTHDYTYNAGFELKSSIDEYKGTLTFRP